jgi:hypothetical protein
MIDFNGDQFADYAVHTLTTGIFTIRYNPGFGSADAGVKFLGSPDGATTCLKEPGGPFPCDILLGDFDGDGWADYAEHAPSTGHFEIHRNLRNGMFSSAVWGSGTTCTLDRSAGDGSPCEVHVADFNGDGFADFADHDPSTAQTFIHYADQHGVSPMPERPPTSPRAWGAICSLPTSRATALPTTRIETLGAGLPSSLRIGPMLTGYRRSPAQLGASFERAPKTRRPR